ncbi:hypothetical protein EHN99_00180 [Salmonella enterica]|nr:hypothetical protein [Salmonella enterica]MEY20170.1 hypothetical protein [Salmonella enterica]
MNKIITIIFNQIKITNASDHSFEMINKNQKNHSAIKKPGYSRLECLATSFPLPPPTVRRLALWDNNEERVRLY